MEQQMIEREISAINFDTSFGNEISKNVKNEESIECYADNVKFACVWQRPEVNVHIINQIINQINVFNDNEYGDCTPSNITALISASFPSIENSDELNDDAAAADDDNDKNNNNNKDDVKKNLNGEMSDITAAFVASTPISTIKTSGDVIALNDDNNDKQMLLLAFNDMSPILFTTTGNRQRNFYRQKRRLHLS
ncbi:hypothetical protein PVAND_005855 [Polypedilum vanderplanki]|uniref:Uncharacterized protein n=1 Tax=Polypedilum vanderplanki TaxID=319348 RepID=A0A9J6C299_POLVA|nr:hypothetical protein PVAND_005855 [Polypedilum vanderplanki]